MALDPSPLPLSRCGIISYGLGGIGWAAISQTVGIQLIYFYIPPDAGGSCLDLEGDGTFASNSSAAPEPIFPPYVPDIKFAVVFNVIALLAAAGRLWDAVTDPLIASLSDNLSCRYGRRIPLLAAGAVPTAVFCLLLFFPIVGEESIWNIVWLAVIQLLFYLSITVYITPYFALVADLGHTDGERVQLAAASSIAFALGSVLAGSVSALGGIFGFERAESGLQAGVGIVCTLATIFMAAPVVVIDERKHCAPPSGSTSLGMSARHCLRNRYFRCYVAADFAFFFASTMVQTAMPFYLTTLLCVPIELLQYVIGGLVLVSFLWYYPIAKLAARHGKKPLIIFGMLLEAAVFTLVYFLGRPLLPMPPLVQLYVLPILLSVSLAILGMLPNAVLADISVHDSLSTGCSNEAMFAAARAFLQKLGVTLGIVLFASLTNFGKDPGDDLGVRLSGPACVVVLLLACLAFTFYDERGMLLEMAAAKAAVNAKRSADGLAAAHSAVHAAAD